MSYLGDYGAGDIIDFKFTTRQASGVPTNLASGTISVYKSNGTTESTTGVTLTAPFDSVVGLNHVRIDTSQDGTFYADGSQFDVVITAGTVNSVSVVGECVGRFTLRAQAALYPTTAGRKLDVSAGGEAGVDWANVGSPTTTVGLSGTTVKTATDVETDTQDIQARLPAVLTADGNIKADTLRVGGTLQTARDLGASVLLSSGTGTGQLDFTSGVVKANLAQILGTALTETAGLLAGGFKKFFNVGTPTGTLNSIPDAVAGAAGGLFIAGNNAATTANITGDITGNLSGSVGSVTAGVTVTTNNDKTGYGLSSAAIQAIWDALTSALTTAGSIGKRLVDFVTGDAFVRLGAPAGASISADIAAATGFIDTEVAAIKAKTDNLPAAPAATSDVTAVPDALLDSEDVESGLTVRQALRIMSAALAGKLSGAATTTVTIRNTADTKNRITATVDADGNRSAVTLDLT